MDPSANIFTFAASEPPTDLDSAKRRNAISLEQRKQLRIRYNEDRTQKQKELATWFETTFNRAINQSSISDTLSDKYAFLDDIQSDKVLGQTRIARVEYVSAFPCIATQQPPPQNPPGRTAQYS